MVEWKVIAEFPEYEVSSDGQVRRGSRIKEARYDAKGYRKVTLSRANKNYTRRIARLVAAAFIGPRPEGQVVRHRDGKCDHDHKDNLQYGTPAQNEADKREHGTAPIGENHPGAKLTAAQVAEIRARHRPYSRVDGAFALAREFKVSSAQIWLIVTRKLWK